MRSLFLLVSVVASHDAFAQAASYDPVEITAGITGSYTGATGRGGGGGLAEIKVLVHDNVAVGARVDGYAMFGGSIGENGDTSMDMAVVASFLAKAEYRYGD